MNVLFLGNSHTYFHDMPELFSRFAQMTCGEKPNVTMLAYSDRDLDWYRRALRGFPRRHSFLQADLRRGSRRNLWYRA